MTRQDGQYWHERVDSFGKLPRLRAMVQTGMKIAHDCLAVADGERVLLVSDTPTSPVIYEVIAGAVKACGGDPTTMVMDPLSTPGAEPPDSVAAAMLASDTIINLCSRSITHTKAAHKAYGEARKRYLVMPAMTEDMMIKGAAMADFSVVKEIGVAIVDAANKASSHEVRMTSEGGTDLTFSVEGRPWLPYYSELRPPRNIEIFPAGEVNNCPIKAGMKGRVVVDTFMMEVGTLSQPIIWEVDEGQVVDISGGSEASALQELLEKEGDENSRYLGEFAIGTNPWARFIGSALEDKQVYGSIHIAMGTDVPNPAVEHPRQSTLHLDGIVAKPDLWVGDTKIVEKGRILVGPTV